MEMLEQMKKEIIKELEESGRKIIPSHNNGGEKLIKLINKFDESQNIYKDKVEKINKRYSKEVAQEKIKELDLELIADKTSLRYDLDAILSDEIDSKKQAIKNNMAKSEYKQARAEALDICLKIGHKLDDQVTAEIIKPIVEAKDLTLLKILKETASKKSSYIYIGAIREVEKYLDNSALETAIKEAKRYINNPKNGKSLTLENFIFNNK